jgi:nitrogenase molybdenum-iron protein beta chain
MVKEAREQRFPVFDLAVPGFRGHAWSGHAAAARALLAQGPSAVDEARAPIEAADVNLFGLVPGLDPGWQDDLFEIEALLAELGLRSHRLIGFDQGLAAWQAAPRARLSLVLSPWGAEAAAWLQQQHGVPVLDAGWLPVGSRDAGRLLALVGAALGVDEARVAAVRQRLDARMRHALCGANTRGLLAGVQRRVVIVGGSAAAVGQARFLAGTLGLAVEWVVITDQPPDDRRAALAAAVHEAAGSATPLSFLASRAAIDTLLRHVIPDVVIGSALEEAVALGLGAAHVEAATPLRRRPALARPQVGVRGGLTLLEDLIAALRAVVSEEPALAPSAAPSTRATAPAPLH